MESGPACLHKFPLQAAYFSQFPPRLAGSPDQGGNLRLIQEYLGHNSPKTTAICAHLTEVVQNKASVIINHFMNGL